MAVAFDFKKIPLWDFFIFFVILAVVKRNLWEMTADGGVFCFVGIYAWLRKMNS